MIGNWKISKQLEDDIGIYGNEELERGKKFMTKLGELLKEYNAVIAHGMDGDLAGIGEEEMCILMKHRGMLRARFELSDNGIGPADF